jgi:hypothetical protein
LTCGVLEAFEKKKESVVIQSEQTVETEEELAVTRRRKITNNCNKLTRYRPKADGRTHFFGGAQAIQGFWRTER